MKKLIWGLLGIGLGACRPPAASTEQARLAAPAAVVAAPVMTPPASAPAAPRIAPADTLTAPMRALLRAYNLAGLWSGRDPEQQASRDTSNAVLDGFFGPDHYRISFVFTQVRQDSINPALFYVSGKNRFKQQITPFTGRLTVQQLADLNRRYLDLATDDSLTRGYTARASFRLQEAPGGPNAGQFEGTGVLDFSLAPTGEIGYAQVMSGEAAPARGQGLLFKGQWVSTKTGQRKELLLARNVFSIAPDVLKNFAIGERDATINPRYAKLGWGNYWENDEWWAEAPKPSPNL